MENNLPEYPALPSFYDSRKIEEIRRTIIVCDVKNEWRLDDLMDCFQRAGEVKYARWAEKDNKTFCMIEFCEQPSIINALKMHGQEFKGGFLSVYHSTDAIVKPEAKSNEAAQKEIEEAMTIVKEAQNMISAAIDPVIGMLAKDKRRRSRSRSRSRDHRTSRSRSHRSRSRKRSRSRTRRRSRSKSKRRSRSRSRRSRSRKRSRSHKRSHSRRKSRSRSRSKRRSRSRDRRSKRSRSRHRRSTSRSRRSRSRTKRSRSRDRKRSHRTREEKRTSRSSRSHSKRCSISPSPASIRSRTSRSKDIGPPTAKTSNNNSSSSKRRSRTPSDRKLKTIAEDVDVKSTRSSVDSKIRKSVSVEKSDNMDISNSP